MKLSVRQGDISSTATDAIVVNLFEGVTSPGGGTGAVDRAMDGAISQLIASGDIRGKLGEISLVHTFGKLASPRVVVVGLGKQADFSVEKLRELSAENARQLYIPAGFAHGFYVLSDVAECQYKCSAYYAPEHERAIRFDDADLAIDWPLAGEPTVSAKDRGAPPFAAAECFD